MPQENFLVEALIEVDAALLGCYRLQASSYRGYSVLCGSLPASDTALATAHTFTTNPNTNLYYNPAFKDASIN